MSIIKPRISFYAEDFGLIKQYLTPEEIVEMFSAIQDLCIFGETDYKPKNAKQQYCWSKLKNEFDKDLASYQTAVQNGKKGGRPAKKAQDETQNITQTETQNITQTETQNITQTESSLTLDTCQMTLDSCQVNSAAAPACSADDGKKYAFEGEVIRLKQKDFDDWQRAYPDLNIYAECVVRDSWLREQPESERKRWFMSTAAYFAKQNERRKRQNAELASEVDNREILGFAEPRKLTAEDIERFMRS